MVPLKGFSDAQFFIDGLKRARPFAQLNSCERFSLQGRKNQRDLLFWRSRASEQGATR